MESYYMEDETSIRVQLMWIKVNLFQKEDNTENENPEWKLHQSLQRPVVQKPANLTLINHISTQIFTLIFQSCLFIKVENFFP